MMSVTRSVQIVRDARGRKVWAEDNPNHYDPLVFDNVKSGDFVPRWGSAALIRLGIQAEEMGLTVSNVTLFKSDVNVSPAETDERARDRVVTAIRSGNAQDALDVESSSYFLRSVNLLASDGTGFRVGGIGAVEVVGEGSVKPLLDVARSIINIT
jgi:hypothetical protein